jgi:signal transduction histidine kinase
VTALARLQGGHETRQVGPVDAGALLTELGESLRPLAEERQLFLNVRGAQPFEVQGDAVKLRRIAQNLVLNAIRYTRRGGVSLSWGDSGAQDAGRWVLQVQDTGPGIEAASQSELANALEVATDNARQVTADAKTGTISHVQDEQAGLADVPTPTPTSVPPAAAELQPGEGIGLSIVKRLCDLLDATVNLDSSANGTTFRILLPRSYG